NKHYLYERSTETLGLLYADHFPYRQKATARGVRRTPFHHHLLEQGAVMGEIAGWERANWFADQGQEREYQYTWKRQNWFENSAAEHKAVRENVGMYDMSSFGKLRVEGPDAESFLNRVCGANMSVPAGKIVYTQFLNSTGGIEADVTVTRLTETVYLVVTPAATRLADETHMRRNAEGYQVVITDVTASEGVLAIMGPNARDLLARVSPNDFSNDTNPFGTAQEIELGMGLARAHRVSYVGELGWELYVPSDMAGHAFETLWEAGQDIGLKLCGMHMMDSCRIEKAFRHFGHDITCEDNVVDAGLSFAVDMSKPDFIGKGAVADRKESGPHNRMVQFLLEDPEPLLFHNEPIVRDGEYVGYLSSGNYGHHLGGAIGLGYVPSKGEKAADVLGSSYEIDVMGTKVKATASLKPMYDPKSERVKV
ncbi:MAG: glycine cleavage T C-terminal barrel domain-containing protein, partial [Pseudomonadota bacterium]